MKQFSSKYFFCAVFLTCLVTFFASSVHAHNHLNLLSTSSNENLQSMLPVDDASAYEDYQQYKTKIEKKMKKDDGSISDESLKSLYTFESPLNEGHVGDDVGDLQDALSAIGYDMYVDGIFGPQTKDQVIKFQRDYELFATGILDIMTAHKINVVLNEKGIERTRYVSKPERKTASASVTVSTAPTSGHWIAINKTTNQLTLFNGQQEITTYPVATGRDPSLTPEGQFKIIVRAVDPDWGGAGRYDPVPGGHPDNPLGSRWLGLDIGGGGTYGIHGTNEPNSIGSYASLGCVRMHNEHVEQLYRHAVNHTPVWIGTQSQLDSWGVNY